jgi:hypothetical protein
MKSFNEYLNEMTLVNRSQGEYAPGTKLRLAKSPNKTLAALIPAGDIEIGAPTDNMVELGSGPSSVILSIAGVTYKLNGSPSAINASFAKMGGGKSDTHKATRVKEAVSLIVFKHYQETNSLISEGAIEAELPKYDADPTLYIDKFFDSAQLQLESYKKIKPLRGNQYIFEFQGDSISKHIYAAAKRLGGPSSADNWNPADLWLFNMRIANTVAQDVGKMTHMEELVHWIRVQYLTGGLCPISLKQASKKSSMELVNPSKYKNKKLDYDFSLNKIIISGSLKSLFIETKSGFTWKGNSRAKENSTTLYLEGTFKQENFAMGAIDAKAWKRYTKGQILNGNKFKFSESDLQNAKGTFKMYSKDIMKKDNALLWPNNFDDFDDTLKRRYVILASHLDFIMKRYDEVMRYSFFSAMKVTDTNSLYVKIK